MTARATPHRLGRSSFALIAASITASAMISLAMDVVLIRYSTDARAVDIVGAAVFNSTAILLALVGSIIEWRRPGHAIGRLMMLAGPLYAFVSAGWTSANLIRPLIDPTAYLVFSWAVYHLSWPAVELFIWFLRLVLN
jgi:hypothetical protein